MEKISGEISQNAFADVMAQYKPLYKASENTLISMTITGEEFYKVLSIAKGSGLKDYKK